MSRKDHAFIPLIHFSPVVPVIETEFMRIQHASAGSAVMLLQLMTFEVCRCAKKMKEVKKSRPKVKINRGSLLSLSKKNKEAHCSGGGVNIFTNFKKH